MNHTIVHFEIPADDPNKLSEFYNELFGWKIEQVPDMDYWMITTAPDGEGVNGGMMTRQAPQQQIMNYVWVESVDDFSDKVVSLGGKILVPKKEVGDMGWFAVCQDPQGNVFALWQVQEAAM
jgi:uncharacterized protein